MGVRLYDPNLGRFLQTDPIEGGNANDYEYCSADPINCFDLDGQWGWSSVKKFVKKHVKKAHRWAKKHTNLVHSAANLAVGFGAGMAAAAVCVGTAGAGCVVFAGAAVGMMGGTLAHLGVAGALDEEVTIGKSLRWMAQGTFAGVSGGVARGALGRGWATAFAVGPKAASPGIMAFLRQPFWGG